VHLDRLQPVFEETGPYVTIHVDVGRASEDGTAQVESRWTTIRHRLEREGVPTTLVSDLGERIRQNTHLAGEVRRTIVVAGGRVVLDDVQPGHTAHPEVVDVGDLPQLAPWIDTEDQAFPFVLAVVDRQGGDVRAYRAASREPVSEESVTGETFYITKVAEGDWAQKQFQQTAENTWHHNAHLVAESVRTAALVSHAKALFIAGEIRARAEVVRAIESIDHGLDSVVQIESGGAGAGADEDALWSEVHERLRELVAAADMDISSRLDEGRGRGQGVATGTDEVLDALVRGQVEELVVDLERLQDTAVQPAHHPGLPLPSSATQAPELPADRVLVAAGALTGARMTVMPATMTRGGGASALLRWDQ
jgi:hypothetical protein